MARETPIVQSIRVELRAEAARRGQQIKIEKRHGSEYSITGEPDLFGSLDGRHFEIEVKVPGEEPEPIQYARLKEWRKTGAITGWATTPTEARLILWPDSAPASRSPRRSLSATRKSKPPKLG